MKWFAILILLFSFWPGHAQYDPSKVNKKAVELYTRALQLAEDDHFREGIQVLQQAVHLDSNYEDAYLSMAGMYGEIKEYALSIANYEKARSLDSDYFRDYNLPYSINLAGEGHFDQALVAIQEFLTIPNLNETSRKSGEYRQRCYRFAIDYASQEPSQGYVFEPENLGDSVNSAVSEYYPTITIDGSKLIFTRRVNNYKEDFFESDWTGGHWGKAKLLTGNINSDQNEGAQNISQDGQWLLFTGCNFPDGFGSCDLYISFLTPEGWSSPDNLGSTVNTEFWESAPSLSPDKKDLYFSSRRPGGFGGSDLYVCHRQADGRWGQPENMGPEINTSGDESTPFIHADNQSLYFTSNGHPGYGGDDLFVARKGPGGKWGKPKNLGYPINTIENEGSLVVAADGKTAYYASDRADSRGGLDIYQFTLRQDVRPARTLWVRGRVYDKKTGKGLPSSVELTDLASEDLVSQLQTDETGNYLITLPVGKDYGLHVHRRGYLFFSENFSLAGPEADSTYAIDIPLQPLEAEATVVLKNIFFELNRYDLKPESREELDEVVRLMKDNPTLVIQISGHTDNLGKPAENLTLSESRARTVVDYLHGQGVESPRLQFRGWGEQRPIADNGTEAGRAMNRRTELKVIGK
jgi:outer membrane protein OmpA-like peptidoglycan-associated protein/tetratricopeptide (TPR) repeat protein